MQKIKFDGWMQNAFNVDPNDAVYQASHGYMTTGIAIASAVTGIYGIGKLAWSISRNGIIKMPNMILSARQCGRSNGFLGYKGFELKNTSFQKTRNIAAEVGGRQYSGHALDQMQNRGIMPCVIDETIKYGTPSMGKQGKTTVYHHRINNVKVVLNKEERVVTNYF